MYRTLIQSPYMSLAVALLLFATSGYEVWESLAHGEVGAHHGLMVFAIVQVLRILPEVIWGLQELDQAKNELNGSGSNQ